MTRDMTEAVAAEFALGTLRGDERSAAEARLARDPDFAAMVETWQRRLGELEGTEEQAPSPDLWSRIDRALDAAEDAPGTRTLRRDEGAWQTVRPGVDKKTLDTDRVLGTQTYLLRIAKGARIPAHDHAKAEECLVIEGDVVFGDTVLRAGDFHIAPSGIGHPDITSHGGGLIFIRGALAA